MNDISKLSIQELKKLQAEAELMIEFKQEQAVIDAFNQITAIANELGFTVLELLEEGAKRNKKALKKPVVPRYRNITNQDETWTGRGKQPRWLVAELEKGAKLEDFLIA